MAVNTAKIKRLVDKMVDPTKLSLVELQQELKRRGMRLNAGTLGNRMHLVSVSLLCNFGGYNLKSLCNVEKCLELVFFLPVENRHT